MYCIYGHIYIYFFFCTLRQFILEVCKVAISSLNAISSHTCLRVILQLIHMYCNISSKSVDIRWSSLHIWLTLPTFTSILALPLQWEYWLIDRSTGADDEEEDEERVVATRATTRPISSATQPIGLPGGVLAEMKGRRGFQRCVSRKRILDIVSSYIDVYQKSSR